MEKTRIGLIGAGFIAATHAESIQLVPDAEVVAVASRSRQSAAGFAQKWGIPHAYADYRELLERKDIDGVVVAVPNYLHAPVVQAAADSGKHILCEKPLCLTLEEAQQMIDSCRANQVKLVYGEPLCYLPKYVRAKQLADEGALGDVFLVKHAEEQPGPHSPWFWDPDQSGGGVLLDMSCHSIEFARWILGRPQVKSVTATVKTLLHKDKTRCDDHSVCVIEFDNGALAVLENSWAKLGGLDDKCEIYGSRGNTFADAVRGNSLLTYSQPGYGYALEKAESTKGWTFTIFDELWTFGYPQQMQHFVKVIQGLEEPIETAEDGMEVLRVICAAYQSAGQGRRIEWPYQPPRVARPIDLWLATAE
jgi:myo-inositol 2-dehydrogenase/D-chiro-inositol 1-dehydrogenase